MKSLHTAAVAFWATILLSAQASGYDWNATTYCSDTAAFPASLTNTSSYALPVIFAPATHPQDPVAVEQIRATLALYPLCIDGKDLASLHFVFTEDAVANYSAPLNILTPLTTIQATLQASLAPVTSQHAYSTQVIELLGPCAARSVTYFRAAQFGMGVYEGQVVYSYGQYRDVLVKLDEGWRVKERTLAYMVYIFPASCAVSLSDTGVLTASLPHRARTLAICPYLRSEAASTSNLGPPARTPVEAAYTAESTGYNSSCRVAV